MTLLDSAEWTGRIFTGKWEPAYGGTLASVEPATGQTPAEVGLADAQDITNACRTARAAQPEWAATPGPERAALLRRAAAIVEANRAELENWLVREDGAVQGKAAFEVGLVLGELWEAAALPTQPWGHLLPTSEAGRESIAQRLPLGVVGVISPWNFPQILSIRRRAVVHRARVARPSTVDASVHGSPAVGRPGRVNR
jgi:benzaldehyde dehydrogenase (NAD)